MEGSLRIFLSSAALSGVVLFGHGAGWFEGLSARAVSDWLRGLDARIWQAVIAGAFVAAGWVVNGWQNRRVAAKLRAEQLRDAHRAIYAEIETNLSNLWSEESLRAEGARVVALMAADKDFVPFIPERRHDRIFASIQVSIHTLPRVTIDPIVAYYSQLDSIAAQADGMRDEAFAALPPARRIVMYEDYIEMHVQALTYGRIANYLIGVYAKSGKEAAERAAARINSSVGDRSGR